MSSRFVHTRAPADPGPRKLSDRAQTILDGDRFRGQHFRCHRFDHSVSVISKNVQVVVVLLEVCDVVQLGHSSCNGKIQL
jgi:hypothetical protein